MYARKNIFIFEVIIHMLVNVNVITSATRRHVSAFISDLNWCIFQLLLKATVCCYMLGYKNAQIRNNKKYCIFLTKLQQLFDIKRR